ncbi:Triosephosphate isomerase [Burkholderiales bacterium]|jgi:triosephosphate isomerase|nr:Triosephosphate isomerase [Burkholderiales bacterium]
MRPNLVAANWKMNGSRADNQRWLQEFRAAPAHCETVVCPPFVYLQDLVQGLVGTAASVGAQNMSDRVAGAWTGEVAAEMLIDSGASWVILGHSERRAAYGESNEIVAAKVERALAAGLKPILCVGETLEQREQGRTQQVVAEQLQVVLQRCPAAQLLAGAIAYEPVWAIGTGRTATPQQAQAVHAAIRSQLAAQDPGAAVAMRLLYGGSVKPANARELFSQPDIDGGLIGGASLVAADFVAICAAAAR